MTRLPDAIDPRIFPLAERSALRLDGVLFPLADVLVAADALDGPELRARAVLGGRSRRLIAELGTAAWVWGAVDALPRRRELCAGIDERARLRPGRDEVGREVVLRREDVAVLGGVRVTTPLRTAVDLARLRADGDCSPAVLRRLLGRDEPLARGVERALALLQERSRLPQAARGRRRIAALAPGREEARPEGGATPP